MKKKYASTLLWVVAAMMFQIGWITSAKAKHSASIKDRLKATELSLDAGAYKLDSLIPLTGIKKGSYLAIFSVDTVPDDYRLLPYFIDSQSFEVYQMIPFDEYRVEGVNPEIRLAFLANADSDRNPELIVQIGWHYDNANAVGWFYQTYIYDRDSTVAGSVIYKKDSESIIPNEAQAVRQGEQLRAKYNTEAKIRRRLKQLGY